MAYSVTVEGGRELVAKLQAEPLLRPAMQKLFRALGQEAVTSAKAAAPRATGRLQASITHRLSTRPVPAFVAIRVPAVSARGYPYPRILEFSPKHHHVAWLEKAVKSAFARIEGLLAAAARDIEETFSRR